MKRRTFPRQSGLSREVAISFVSHLRREREEDSLLLETAALIYLLGSLRGFFSGFISLRVFICLLSLLSVSCYERPASSVPPLPTPNRAPRPKAIRQFTPVVSQRHCDTLVILSMLRNNSLKHFRAY